MKLKSLKNLEVLNKEAVQFISGGVSQSDSRRRDVSSTSNDCYSRDKAEAAV